MRTCQILAASIVAAICACGGSPAATPSVPPPTVPSAPPALLPPTNLRYAFSDATFTVGVAIPRSLPSSDGGAVSSYSVSPPLPAGLALAPSTGEIAGTPAAPSAASGYVVTASNAAGSATARLTIAVEAPAPVVTVPGAPTVVEAQAGDASATLTWTAPASDGGSPITGYVVTPVPAADRAAVATSGTGASVTGLLNGTAYAFTVAAVNAVGTGPASAPSPIVTPSAPAPPPPVPAPTAPGAPTAVAGVAGDRSVSLTWAAPSSSGGAAITGYTVTPSPAAPSASVAVTGTTATVSGLTNGTTYSFTVRARNAVGTGPASAPSAGLTPRAPDTLSEGTHLLSVVVSPDAGLAVPVSGISFALSLPAGVSVAVAGGGSSEIPASALVAGSAVAGVRMLSGSYSGATRTARIALAFAPETPWSGQAIRIAFTVAPGALVTASQVVGLNEPPASLKVVGFDVSAHRTVILTGQVRVAVQVLDP